MKGVTIRHQFRAPRQVSAAPLPSKPQSPSRVALLLALAHYIEHLIESGDLRDYAEAALALGLTRARITQVMNLLLLSPEIQERVLRGDLQLVERTLRRVHREPEWPKQGELFDLP